MQIFRGIPQQNRVPIALTLGNFDGVHIGHQAMLVRLKQVAISGLVPSVMTFEPHPREFFMPHEAPGRLTSLREKLYSFSQHGIEHVYVCHFNRHFANLSAEDFVEQYLYQLQVKQVVVGDDFRFGKNRSGNLKTLQASAQESGFVISAVDSVLVNNKRVSSTVIREELTQGNLETAAEFLGRPYSMIGKVTQGNKIGRSIGFPTANILVKHNRAPFYGIFVVNVIGLDKRPLPGVASLGIRPTLKEQSKPVLEVHILNFDKQIYGQYIEIQFLKKLRNEEKYMDLETLSAQIACDVEDAKKYFNKLKN